MRERRESETEERQGRESRREGRRERRGRERGSKTGRERLHAYVKKVELLLNFTVKESIVNRLNLPK